MQTENDILMDNRVIGQATVVQKGLYYNISCKCMFDDRKIYRIQVKDDAVTLDLGICVPEANIFTLNRMIPAKKIGQGIQHFYAEPAYPENNITPVSEDQAFEDLDRVINGQLEVTQDQIGITFTDQSQDQQGNDLSP